MLAKGKAPKVPVAAARREPVVDIGEGRQGESPASLVPFTGQPFTGQSLAALWVEGPHLFLWL